MRVLLLVVDGCTHDLPRRLGLPAAQAVDRPVAGDVDQPDERLALRRIETARQTLT